VKEEKIFSQQYQFYIDNKRRNIYIFIYNPKTIFNDMEKGLEEESLLSQDPIQIPPKQRCLLLTYNIATTFLLLYEISMSSDIG